MSADAPAASSSSRVPPARWAGPSCGGSPRTGRGSRSSAATRTGCAGWRTSAGLADDAWMLALGELTDRAAAQARRRCRGGPLRADRRPRPPRRRLGGRDPVADLDPDELARMLDQHLWTTLHVTQAAVPGMVERGFGRVLAVTSPFATNPAAKGRELRRREGRPGDAAADARARDRGHGRDREPRRGPDDRPPARARDRADDEERELDDARGDRRGVRLARLAGGRRHHRRPDPARRPRLTRSVARTTAPARHLGLRRDAGRPGGGPGRHVALDLLPGRSRRRPPAPRRARRGAGRVGRGADRRPAPRPPPRRQRPAAAARSCSTRGPRS